MPLPSLEDLTPGLDRICADVLGETIRYCAEGQADFVDTKAHVDYRDGEQQLAGTRLVAQSPQCELLKVDVPAKPNREVRLTLAKRVGQMFRPVNVSTDSSGTHWVFDCEEVPNG